MKPEIKGFFHQWASNLWARRYYFSRQFLAILPVSVASKQLPVYGPSPRVQRLSAAHT